MAKVTNRSGGTCVYRIPDKNIRRVFQPHESKNISEEELNDAVSQPGGRALFYHYLQIEDNSIASKVLNLQLEPEYSLTEEEMPTWLVSCSLDELKDALDFAPEGVKDLIKSYAVSLRLNDMNKIQAIKEALNFDVIEAIKNTSDNEENKSTAPVRRTNAPSVKKTETATD